MRRIIISIAALACVSLAALGGWFFGRSPLEETISALRSRLQNAQSDLDESRDELATAMRGSKSEARLAKERRRLIRNLRSGLYALKTRAKRLGGLEEVLAAGPGRLSSARLVPSGSYDLLVVARNRSFAPGGASGSSLDVWRVEPGAAPSWELVFRLVPDPRIEVMLVGPPGSESREESDAYSVWLADAGDVTGDGVHDLAIQQWNTGSGGCGVARVLENNPWVLEEIFRRDACDHTIAIKRGHVVYRHAIWPKGCNNAHGCGSKRMRMAWDGGSWVIVEVNRKIY